MDRQDEVNVAIKARLDVLEEILISQNVITREELYTKAKSKIENESLDASDKERILSHILNDNIE